MPHKNQMSERNYNQNPFIVIWEVTRACALHCLHCRAEAQHRRHPEELSTEEGKQLLREIHSMDSPIFVFTGGDPLMRDDLFELAAYGKQLGLRVSLTPSATPRVTEAAMRQAVEIGLDRWAFSLDGSTAAIHDRFRGASGSYELTMRSLAMLRQLQMPLQINTTVSVHNRHDLKQIAQMIAEMGVVMWSVFFLVPTGRGKQEDMISAEEGEEVLHWLAELSRHVPFQIKTTAAPFYRRILAEHNINTRDGKASDSKAAMRAPRGVTDGNGFVFISHTGVVSPSGFLPLDCGNVRDAGLAHIYRNHPVFTSIRNPDLYRDKCGICDYRFMCGGSRARAYSASGDYLGSDPACAYLPQNRLFSSIAPALHLMT